MNRLLTVLIAAIVLTGCVRGSAEPDETDGYPEVNQILNAGFLVTESVFNSELIAPYDILHHTIFRDSTRYIRPFIVSPEGNSVTSFEGLTIDAHYSFDNVPPIDILLIPSTDASMADDLENERLINWIRDVAASARWVVTLCDGAFPLAQTGLLDGRQVTTFPADRDFLRELFPNVTVNYDVDFVVDGKFITSVGGAKSYDPALYLVETLYSRASAERTAEGLVIDWDLSRIPHLIANE